MKTPKAKPPHESHAWLQDCGCYYCGHCGTDSTSPKASKPCKDRPPDPEKAAWDSFQKELGDWCDKTFPNSTPKTILAHFKSESKELLDATDAETDHEIADCMMLLLHLAHKRGVSARDAIRDKFEICKKRKWGPPDAQGVVRHVE
jgi:NTP pyrophosphatase (non-canonical NTP hydrolase)